MRTLLGHRIFKPPFSLTVTVSRAGSGIKRSVRVEQRRFPGFILTPSPARGSARQGGLGVFAQPRAEPDRRRTLLPAAIDATAHDRVWPKAETDPYAAVQRRMLARSTNGFLEMSRVRLRDLKLRRGTRSSPRSESVSRARKNISELLSVLRVGKGHHEQNARLDSAQVTRWYRAVRDQAG